jgi:uncharacterized protein YehS (DUF1456 family)
MTNNDVLRRLRYTLDYGDKRMMELFALADREVSRAQLSNWLKKDDDDEYQGLKDVDLASFLNGLITDMRGAKDGEKPVAETELTNNIVLRKIMIAFSMKSDDVLEILQIADLKVSKPELSAFFRKPTHKHYRVCKDQILRNFLSGLQDKLKPRDVTN